MDWTLATGRKLGGDDGLTARATTEGDLAKIVEIEGKAHPTPWPREIFERELGLEVSTSWTISRGRQVVGFLVFWVVHDEVHILNVAVDPAHRRQGIATAVLEQLIEMARQFTASFVTLEVRENNQAAIGLYESLGFDIIGQREAYYADTGEDAYIMSCLI